MEYKKLAKQFIDMNKNSFNNIYNAVVLFQDQAERMTHTWLDQAPWVPEDTKKTMDDWVGAYKKGRDDYKNSVDSGFEKIQTFFDAQN